LLMRLNVSQNFRLEQRMKLSPSIIQAMEILQLPLLALRERIDQELTSNPCLERQELGGGGDGPAQTDLTESPQRGEEPLVVREDNSQDDFERLADFGEMYGE